MAKAKLGLAASVSISDDPVSISGLVLRRPCLSSDLISAPSRLCSVFIVVSPLVLGSFSVPRLSSPNSDKDPGSPRVAISNTITNLCWLWSGLILSKLSKISEVIQLLGLGGNNHPHNLMILAQTPLISL